jgi:hypothetical protein
VKSDRLMKKKEMFRYLAEPRNILAEPLGFAEPRLKNTGLKECWVVRRVEVS